jgi:hypothetical protein
MSEVNLSELKRPKPVPFEVWYDGCEEVIVWGYYPHHIEPYMDHLEAENKRLRMTLTNIADSHGPEALPGINELAMMAHIALQESGTESNYPAGEPQTVTTSRDVQTSGGEECVWSRFRANYQTECGHYLESYNGFGESDIGDRGDYCRYCGRKIRIEEDT